MDFCDKIGFIIDALDLIVRIAVKLICIYESDEPGETIRALLGLLFYLGLLGFIVYYGFGELFGPSY